MTQTLEAAARKLRENAEKREADTARQFSQLIEVSRRELQQAVRFAEEADAYLMEQRRLLAKAENMLSKARSRLTLA